MIEKSEPWLIWQFWDEDLIEYRVSCDKCSFYQDFEAFNFNDLRTQMIKSSWVVKRNELDIWEDICFECKESENER